MSARLNSARLSRIVGRDGEAALLNSMFQAQELPCCALYVSGPGGVGKTSLLTLWSDIAERAGVFALRLDMRNAEPAPVNLIGVLWDALPASSGDVLAQSLDARIDQVWRALSEAANGARVLLMLDTYERLEPMDDWVRDVWLQTIPDNVLLVLAGRTPPSSQWRADPAWGLLIRHLPLRNLGAEAGRAYLSTRQVPEDQHDAVLRFTHGHPLALSLVADTFAQRNDAKAFSPQEVPSIIRTLIEQFIQRVPGPAHRAALEACALVRVLSESLLVAMLDLPADSAVARETTHELFDWLRGLSFIESGPGGLFPHDLAREALSADVRWRNPDWYTTLHDRARKHYGRRMHETHGADQQINLIDYVWLHRDSVALRQYFEWEPGQTLYIDGATVKDFPLLTGWVEQHEGAASAQIAAHWFLRQPQNVYVIRDGTRQPVAFATRLSMREMDADDFQVDPHMARCHAWLQAQGGLRANERALIFRFWMSAADHQFVNRYQSMVFLDAVQTYLTMPKLALSFFCSANPDFWQDLFAYADIPRVPELDFDVNGAIFGTFAHNWRNTPPVMWLEMLARREVGAASPDEPITLPEQVVALSEADFAAAVREALRDYTRQDALEGNVLLGSKLIVEQAGARSATAERVKALRAAVLKSIEALEANPRDAKLARALRVTYITPAPTQEAAAERIDVPFSTYRRHLQSGLLRVIEMLWTRELGT